MFIKIENYLYNINRIIEIGCTDFVCNEKESVFYIFIKTINSKDRDIRFMDKKSRDDEFERICNFLSSINTEIHNGTFNGSSHQCIR